MSEPAQSRSQEGSGQAEQALCIGCGLCCDGTFLDRGKVADVEAAPIESYKNAFSRDEGKLWFALPCPHYEGGCCTIYDSRFATCRTYRCKLLKKFDAREVSFSNAKHTISIAKALVATVADNEPGARMRAGRLRYREELRQALAKADDEERPRIARRLLDVATLDRFIELNFHERKHKDPDKTDDRGS